MKTASIESLHGEHREWEAEIGLWRDDLRAWQHETRDIENQVDQLLAEHQNELRVHAATLRLREEAIAQHEHTLAGCCASKQTIAAGTCEDHASEKTDQLQKRSEHELLKHSHHELIGRLRRILKTFPKR
jgi:hypothetical protein